MDALVIVAEPLNRRVVDLARHLRIALDIPVLATAPQRLEGVLDGLRRKGLRDIVTIKVQQDQGDNGVLASLVPLIFTHLDSLERTLLGRLMHALIEETGDIELALSIRVNPDLNEVLRRVKEARIIVLDDLRVMPFIDVRKVKVGVKITHMRTGSLSYTDNSIVVIGSKAEYINDLLKYVREGLKPLLIIATPPALSKDKAELKEKILELDVPSIITCGSRGGAHVGGIILNTLIELEG